jgi:hypothetical protein
LFYVREFQLIRVDTVCVSHSFAPAAFSAAGKKLDRSVAWLIRKSRQRPARKGEAVSEAIPVPIDENFVNIFWTMWLGTVTVSVQDQENMAAAAQDAQ